MHIGGATNTIEIGGIDQPVVRDPITEYPYIPGSSLKGKVRSFVERSVRKNGSPLRANRSSSGDNKIFRHECDDFSEAYTCPLCRVFGSTGKDSQNTNHPSKILFRDGHLLNEDYLKQDNLLVLEAKMENTLDRLTSAAMPRTIERVPAGAEFGLDITYRIEELALNGSASSVPDMDVAKADMENLFQGLNLIEMDGIGGHISRGYGQVVFHIDSFARYAPDGEQQESFDGTSLSDTIASLRKS